MKFHKFFSLKRFGRLLAADLQLNSKRYLYLIAGAAVGMYLLMLVFLLNGYNVNHYPVRSEFYMTTFILSLMAFVAYAGSAFPSFSEKPATAGFLLFPASGFEKLMSQFLIYIVAGISLFLFLFWVDAHLVRLSLSNLESVRTGKWLIEPFNYSMMIFRNDSYRNVSEYYMQWLMFFSVGCFLFTARLFFGKFALAKSIICGIVLAVSGTCLMVLCSHLFFPEKTQGFEVSINFYHTNFFDMGNDSLFIYSLCGIICLFFLPLAYFKLKEKQL